MTSDFGLRIGVEGEKEFKNALRDLNQSFKVLGSEMKLVSSEFDKQDKSVAAVTARNEVLNKAVDAQKDKIKTLEDALRNASESFGENDKRTQNWAIQLNNAKASLNEMERKLDESAESTDDLGDELKETGDEAEKSGGKFEKLGSVLKGIGAAMGAVAVAAGAAAIKLGKEVIAAYADYEQLVGGVDTLFGEASQTVQGFAENAFKTAGMSANEYMETVTGFSASLIQSLGGDTAKAAQVADMAITDMADNANKMGSDISSIQTAYQGFAKQNYTMLDNLKLGYGGTKSEMVRLLADAEKFSGIKYDISSYADVAEAIHVIQTEIGITGTTAKEATETISGSVAGMQSAVGNLMAGLGDTNADIGLLIGNVVEAFQNVVKNIVPVIENIVTALPPALDGILQAVGDLLPTLLSTVVNLFTQVLNTILMLLPELIPAAVDAIMTIAGALIENLPLLIDAAMQLVTALVQGIGDALPELIPAAITAIITIVEGLLGNMPMLLDAALQLILGLAEGLLTAIPQLIEKLPAIIEAIVTFVVDAIPQIIDAGIKLLISLVQALPEIITAIVKAIPQIIESVIVAVIGSIPQIIDAGIKLFIALIENLPTIIQNIVGAVPQIISGVITAVTGAIPQIIMAGVQLFVSLIENLPTVIIEIAKAVPQIIASLVDGFAKSLGEMSKIGGNLIKGVWQGISDAGAWLRDKISGFFGGVVDSIKDFFGIHSPSALFAGLGGNMAQGLGIGFGDEMAGIGEDMKNAIPNKFDVNADINVTPEVNSTGAERSHAWLEQMKADIEAFAPQIAEIGNQFFGFVVSDEKSIFKIVTAVVPKIIDSLKTTFRAFTGAFFEIGANFGRGLAAGMQSEISYATQVAVDFARRIESEIRSQFGIESPSKKFAELGGYMAQGLGVGFGDLMTDVGDKISRAIDSNIIIPTIDLSAVTGDIYGTNSVMPQLSSIPVQYTVNQTFTSPRALDPYETKRLSRLGVEQAAMALKGGFA